MLWTAFQLGLKMILLESVCWWFYMWLVCLLWPKNVYWWIVLITNLEWLWLSNTLCRWFISTRRWFLWVYFLLQNQLQFLIYVLEFVCLACTPLFVFCFIPAFIVSRLLNFIFISSYRSYLVAWYLLFFIRLFLWLIYWSENFSSAFLLSTIEFFLVFVIIRSIFLEITVISFLIHTSVEIILLEFVKSIFTLIFLVRSFKMFCCFQSLRIKLVLFDTAVVGNWLFSFVSLKLVLMLDSPRFYSRISIRVESGPLTDIVFPLTVVPLFFILLTHLLLVSRSFRDVVGV